MLSTARTITGAAAAAATLVAIASPAFASDVNHNSEYNGISVANGNNVQLPVGLCNNNVAIVGAVVAPILSPQSAGGCAAAAINQSSAGSGQTTPETPAQTSPSQGSSSSGSSSSSSSNASSAPSASSMPSAPTPTPMAGNVSVTG